MDLLDIDGIREVLVRCLSCHKSSIVPYEHPVCPLCFSTDLEVIATATD